VIFGLNENDLYISSSERVMWYKLNEDNEMKFEN